MWRIDWSPYRPEHLLPVLLLAALLAGPSAVSAQRLAENSSPLPVAARSFADPEPPPTPEDIGDSFLIQRRYQEAIDKYKKVPGDSAAVWNKMGIAYQMLFDMKDAERCYKESLRVQPNVARVVNNLATIYASLKDFSKAERLYRKALKLDPTSALIATNLGTNLLARHKYREGWAMYEHALELNPKIFDGHGVTVAKTDMPLEQRGAMNYYKAKSCMREGLTKRAIEYLRLALNEGFADPSKVAQDESFTGLRNNPTFEKMLTEQNEQYAAR